MDPFLSLLHSFSSSLLEPELASLKFLCREKIGKRKLESVQSGVELFGILLEQQLIAKDRLDFLEGLLRDIKREDLISQLKQFVEDGEVTDPADQPDVHERRLQKAAIEVICENVGKNWRMLVRKLGVSEVKMERIIAAYPCDLREQLFQSLREWQKWKGKDAKVTDLIKALRGCHMNLVADKVEEAILLLNTGAS
ncbi:FAS-associated death domain protein [Columba livia]|uniref:FAS-associated death domain protein n=1 Tax=Columba livia TaxID=8932 RepID=A0A2I0MI45_COLLI|nr:FAS-associated death domain protein [Columba livia]KAK2520371.1 Fadd [Columba livia]PKK29349.1 Fas (TNFRSF6)-associated via death domain [Columba livia]